MTVSCWFLRNEDWFWKGKEQPFFSCYVEYPWIFQLRICWSQLYDVENFTPLLVCGIHIAYGYGHGESERIVPDLSGTRSDVEK